MVVFLADFEYPEVFGIGEIKNEVLFLLKLAGINGSLLNWIYNFLYERTFVVKVETSYSTPKPVLSVVPQGSILGPLLFIFFIHDIPDYCSMPGIKLKLYADGLKAFVIHKKINPPRPAW